MRKRILGAAALLALMAAACNQPAATTTVAQPEDEAATLALTCDAFADLTGASLATTYGAENITTQTLPGPEGESYTATVLYPNDPTRTLVIVWADPETQLRPASISAREAASIWTGAHDLSVGDTIAAVETANGHPFQLWGFGWDYGGWVSDWKDGAFADVNGCRTRVRFDPRVDPARCERRWRVQLRRPCHSRCRSCGERVWRRIRSGIVRGLFAKVAAIIFSLVATTASAHAQTPPPNVILVTIDGVRWQELFRGADPALVTDDATRTRFVDVPDRAAALAPFILSFAQSGALVGNRDAGSCARVANRYWFSYPGYAEILAGRPNPSVQYNAAIPNSDVTVLSASRAARILLAKSACSRRGTPFLRS